LDRPPLRVQSADWNGLRVGSRAGVGAMAHFGGLVATGVDSVEHGNEVTDEQLKQMRDKGIFLAAR